MLTDNDPNTNTVALLFPYCERVGGYCFSFLIVFCIVILSLDQNPDG